MLAMAAHTSCVMSYAPTLVHAGLSERAVFGWLDPVFDAHDVKRF
jgi:hypothetical protein